MFVVPVSRQTQEFARSLDRLFAGTPDSAANDARTPALDLAETEQAYTVTMDLPGVGKDEVNVSVEGRRVSIQAQRNSAKAEGERLVYRERSAPRYARQFTLPQEVDPAAAQARLDQGVLTLSLPKRAARTASRISIN